MLTPPAVIAGRDVGGKIVSCPAGRLKPMVQGAVQTAGLLASRMAWRSEPVPESAFVVTTSDDVPPMPTFEAVVLLPLFESDSVAEAEALRTAVPLPVAVRLMVCVAVALRGSVPMVQVIVVDPLQVPCVDVGDPLSVTFAGSVIVAVTFVAAAGPRFVTT